MGLAQCSKHSKKILKLNKCTGGTRETPRINRECGNCKYNGQGKSSAICIHPKAYKERAEYIYWNYSCDKFEEYIKNPDKNND